MNLSIKRVGAVACLLLLIPNIASAFYAAHMGRWISRDSYGDSVRLNMESLPDGRVLTGFISRDSSSSTPGYQDGMNLYQYVKSTPTNAFDPSGQLHQVAPLVCTTPVGAAATSCVFGPYIAYKVGQCTTGPITKLAFDLYYKPCDPCPEPPPPVTDTTHDHGDCFKKTGSNTHWHYFVYHLNEETCECFGPYRKFGGCGPATDPH